MKFRKSVSILAISIVVFCLGFYCLFSYNKNRSEDYYRVQIDGLAGEKYCLEHGEDTRYSPKFSHQNFAKIKVGMKEKEVIDLLGEPLTRFSYASKFKKEEFEKGHFIGLKYSDSPTSKNYRLRIIQLDYGIVVGILGEVYYD